VERHPQHSNYEAFLFLIRLGYDNFLKPLSNVSNGEIAIISPSVSNSNSIEISTFTNTRGALTLPQFDAPLLRSLKSLTPGAIHETRTVIDVRDYTGYTMPGIATFYRGDDRFPVYGSFSGIFNNGQLIAYLGVLVPEDALLAGPRK